MSRPLPVISGQEAVNVFKRVGYLVVRQKGSHVRLVDDSNAEHRPLTIPLHRELDRGLLRSLIRQAGLTVDQFCDLL